MAVQKKRMWLRLLVALLALAMLAAACGDDDDGDAGDDTGDDSGDAGDDTGDDSGDTGDDTGDDSGDTGDDGDDSGDTGDDGDDASMAPEKSEVRVGIIPIADVAPVYIGINQGFFEAEGLTLAPPEFSQGGAAAIPTLISGDIDFAFGAYPSFFSAVEQGQPLLIATEANRAAPLFGGILAMPDSGITTPADLAGKKIAVNTLDNLVQLAVEAQIGEAGLSLADVTLVEIPFPEMVPTLERGDVDAIATVEPFVSRAQNDLGATLVTDMFAAPIDGFPVAGFYVTQSFADENPNTVAAFNRGFAAAVEYANTVENAVEQAMTTYIGEDTTVESFAGLNFPLFVSGLDTDYIQTVPDYMLDSGLLGEAVSAAEYVVAG